MGVTGKSRWRLRAGPDSAIVVFGFPGLGDLVRCHSLIRMIAEQNPGRPIDLVARRSVAEIAAFMPEIRDAFGEDFSHNSLSVRARLGLANELRKRRYGTAYLIQSSFKSALVPFLAGIPERIGWSDEGRRLLLTRPHVRMRSLPRMVDRICWLGLGDDAPRNAPLNWPEPRLAVPPALAGEFELLGRHARAAAPVVAIAPFSAHAYKNWPIGNYAAVARHYADAGYTVWMVGARRDSALADEIRAQAPVRDYLTESLTKLALTIAAADVFIGNDSGPLHIAAAFNKPTVGIFGHMDIDAKVPINPNVKVVAAERTVAQTSRTAVNWPSLDAVIRRCDEIIAEGRTSRPRDQVRIEPRLAPGGR